VAAITDPRAVAFANQQLRVADDLTVQLYRTLKNLLQNWSATGGNYIALFPTGTANIVTDGASVNGVDAAGGDGRPLMNGSIANNIISRANELVNVLERGTLDTSGTQDFARLNTLLAAVVNGQPKF
jgi:hypothetical protein